MVHSCNYKAHEKWKTIFAVINHDEINIENYTAIISQLTYFLNIYRHWFCAHNILHFKDQSE